MFGRDRLAQGEKVDKDEDATDRETRIDGVPTPDQLADQIRSNMRRLRQKSLFVEQL